MHCIERINTCIGTASLLRIFAPEIHSRIGDCFFFLYSRTTEYQLPCSHSVTIQMKRYRFCNTKAKAKGGYEILQIVGSRG